jgi:hypothetical protein
MIVRAIVIARSLFPGTTPRAHQLVSVCLNRAWGVPVNTIFKYVTAAALTGAIALSGGAPERGS